MKIDKSIILKLEELSKLQLSEEERSELIKDLNDILKMVEKLDELDLKDVEPLTHILNEKNELRKDVIMEHLNRKIAMRNAPDTTGEFFKVPKVIKD